MANTPEAVFERLEENVKYVDRYQREACAWSRQVDERLVNLSMPLMVRPATFVPCCSWFAHGTDNARLLYVKRSQCNLAPDTRSFLNASSLSRRSFRRNRLCAKLLATCLLAATAKYFSAWAHERILGTGVARCDAGRQIEALEAKLKALSLRVEDWDHEDGSVHSDLTNVANSGPLRAVSTERVDTSELQISRTAAQLFGFGRTIRACDAQHQSTHNSNIGVVHGEVQADARPSPGCACSGRS